MGLTTAAIQAGLTSASGNITSSGGLSGASNTTTIGGGSLWTGSTTLTVPNYSGYTYTLPQIFSNPQFTIQIEKVENGWIVHKEGKKFVATKPEDILQYLQEDTK